MQGDSAIIKHLQTVLRGELTGINQYFLHSRMLDHWGVGKLGKHEYDESIEEMKHADSIIKRLFFLGALPNLQDLNKLLIGEDVKEILECDLKLEQKAVTEMKAAIASAESVKDFVSRDLLREMLKSEEHHVDFIETQLTLIQRVGMENYVQLQSPSAS